MVDCIEPDLAKHAADWSAWGHRMLVAIAAADGFNVLALQCRAGHGRRGPLQPVCHQAERRQLAAARRGDLHMVACAAQRRWHVDLTQFETTVEGT